MKNPAENLVGTTLDGGWKVIEKKVPPPISSGGNFSIGYIVSNEKERAFLKVLDITRAFRFSNFTVALEGLLQAHNYECELLDACQNRRMTKIVNVYAKGQINVPQEGSPIPIPPIPYLIFELAETNSREILNTIDEFDIAFSLRSLHSVAVGLNQLHNAGIVHQDTKPSNVLHFTVKNEHKLGDLGRGDVQDTSPHSDFKIAGDPSYAPPELLYNDVSSDWKIRRQACDAYHLGSLLMYYFTHTDTTAMIKSHLPSEFHWNNWGGSYSEALPYVYEAFDISVGAFTEILEKRIHNKKAVEDLQYTLRMLCEPSPLKRGHPKDIASIGNSFSLVRFITIFNRWATQFELGLK